MTRGVFPSPQARATQKDRVDYPLSCEVKYLHKMLLNTLRKSAISKDGMGKISTLAQLGRRTQCDMW
jgi:hypothetical protein